MTQDNQTPALKDCPQQMTEDYAKQLVQAWHETSTLKVRLERIKQKYESAYEVHRQDPLAKEMYELAGEILMRFPESGPAGVDDVGRVARALYIDEYGDATEFDKGRGCEVPTMMRRAKAALAAMSSKPVESGGELVGELAAVLKEHHKWQLDNPIHDKEYGFPYNTEYADSSMYERTQAALSKLPKGEM